MVKSISEIQSEAKDCILKNRLNKAIELVNSFIGNYELSNSQLEKNLILISKEYFDIRERGIKGILTNDEVSILENKLINRFLTLIDDLDDLRDELLLLKTKKDVGGLVSADYYINNQLNQLISKILTSDHKISELKITIEDKKNETSRSNDKSKIRILNDEIEDLKIKLIKEQSNYRNAKSKYDDLKIKYDKLEEGSKKEVVNNKCRKCNSELSDGSRCSNCLYENNDLKMIRENLSSLNKDYELILETRNEKEAILKEIKTTNSLILQYLDDINRKLNNLEKRIK